MMLLHLSQLLATFLANQIINHSEHKKGENNKTSDKCCILQPIYSCLWIIFIRSAPLNISEHDQEGKKKSSGSMKDGFCKCIQLIRQSLMK